VHAKKAQAGSKTPEYLACFNAALSELTEATQAAINLVTGLPVADFQRDRGRLRDLLLGTHQFVREGRRGQSLTVESVRVIPQAWGAVLALLLDDKGRIVRSELTQQKVGVLDIGGHTVNYLAVMACQTFPAKHGALSGGLARVRRCGLSDRSTPRVTALK
jgi:hypothetical protein